MFGYKHVSEFTHTAETLLVRVRNGEIPLTGEIVEVLLKCKDHITELLTISEANYADRTELIEYGAAMTSVLELLGGKKSSSAEPPKSASSKAAPAAVKPAGPLDWGITLKFKPDLFSHGLDPFPIIRYLRHMGEILKIKTIGDNIPVGSEFDSEKCYGSNVTFNVSMSKLGPSSAIVLRLNMELPSGLQYVSDTAQGACTFSGGLGTCDFDNFAAGATRSIA